MKLDEPVLRSLLARLSDHIGRVEAKHPLDRDRLLADRDLQDIVSHNLEKAIQICIDIALQMSAAAGRTPQTGGEGFRVLGELGLIEPALVKKLVSAVGFRNLSVHRYAELDWGIVAQIGTRDIGDLKAFGRRAANLLDGKD